MGVCSTASWMSESEDEANVISSVYGGGGGCVGV